jgi:hypothetical protein
MELMESLEYARAYTDDLLCISRKSLDDHLDKLDKVLKRLRDAGLNVNADNRHSAHLKENTWGTYLLKTESNLRVKRCRLYSQYDRPKGVKQLRHFLDMVQYFYYDLWARRSDMLAPLTSLP